MSVQLGCIIVQPLITIIVLTLLGVLCVNVILDILKAMEFVRVRI